MTCPHCVQSIQPAERCAFCGKILPVLETDSHYQTLGYDEEILNLNLEDLEMRFLSLNKKFHPDRFAGKSAIEQEIAQSRSAAVNNAYRTLKDPLSRAKYLVERKFGSVEEKSAQVPMDMAEYFFEIQDLLESINGEQPPNAALKEIREAEKSLQMRIAELEEIMQQQFLAYDASFDIKILDDIKTLFSERAYIKSFLREIDKRVNVGS